MYVGFFKWAYFAFQVSDIGFSYYLYNKQHTNNVFQFFFTFTSLLRFTDLLFYIYLFFSFGKFIKKLKPIL